jgi:predicted nucleic acid-binding protein
MSSAKQIGGQIRIVMEKMALSCRKQKINPRFNFGLWPGLIVSAEILDL